jgi:hypothetical protein
LIFADGRLTSLVALSSKQQFPSEVVGLHITLITARSVDTEKRQNPDRYLLDDAQKKQPTRISQTGIGGAHII